MAKNQKGFTLIEFLIALVIIGFIVTLLVNFFGNPLKEASVAKAATEIIDDGNTLAKAVIYYQSQKEMEPLNLTAVVNAGYVQAALKEKAYFNGNAMWADFEHINLGDGVSRPMMVFSFWTSKQEELACQRINNMVAGMAPDAAIPVVSGTDTVWDARPAELVGKGTFCVHVGGANGPMYFYVPI